jgi:hypothetical protein
MDAHQVNSIRDAIRTLLDGFGLSPSQCPPSFDEALYKLLLDDARRRRYPVDDDRSPLLQCFKAGTAMASTAYAAVPDLNARIFIGLVTGLTIYIDNSYEHDVSGLDDFAAYLFNPVGVSALTSGHEMRGDGSRYLKIFADLIRETPKHVGEGAGAMMVQASAVDFVAGTILEHDLQRIKVCLWAYNNPRFCLI